MRLLGADLQDVPNDNGTHRGPSQHVLTKHTEDDGGQEEQSP